MSLVSPALFVNEDVEKRENRVNLAFFGLLNIGVLRGPLLAELRLPGDSIVYPPQSITEGLRPDFVVMAPSGEEIRAWIEV